MAFYFALLNVSKKDDRNATENPTTFASSSSSRRRRRHSIASIELPLLDYRLLPRPQVMSEQTSARQTGRPNNAGISSTMEDHRRDHQPSEPTNKSRGRDRDRDRGPTHQDQPCSSRSHNDLRREQAATSTLARSSRMLFPPPQESAATSQKKENKKDQRRRARREVKQSTVPEAVRRKKSTEPQRPPARDEPQPKPRKGVRTANGLPLQRPNRSRTVLMKRGDERSPMGSTTSESRRSSGMSNQSIARRSASPPSSCDSQRRIVESASSSVVHATAKLSTMSVSSRFSEPRLKRVTFENSPYVISNSFLGDRAVLVRRGSGTAVLQLPFYDDPSPQTPRILTNTMFLSQRGAASGDDWWTPLRGDEEAEGRVENRANRAIEMASKPKLRSLLRRRSTSDCSRILAYRNSGFLSAAEEQHGRDQRNWMTVSVDRPTYARSKA